jgi:hypothetical protein
MIDIRENADALPRHVEMFAKLGRRDRARSR